MTDMTTSFPFARLAYAAVALGAIACAAPEMSTEPFGIVESASPAMPASGDPGAAGPAGARAGTTGGETGSATGSPTAPVVTLAECVPAPSCDGALPVRPPPRGFRNTTSSLVALLPSSAAGHDTLIAADAPQRLVGRFAYGAVVPLRDDDVDVYVERGSGGEWSAIGTARTTSGERAAVDGVADDGGRVFFEIPNGDRLAIGRHRVLMVARGDGTRLDFVVDVLPAGTHLAITDVDGTLTMAEDAEIGALATGTLPAARPDAAQIFSTLASKGYRIAYVTARPEWLMARTRAFLDENGFPRGIVRTATDTLFGHKGAPAVTYKTAQLGLLGAASQPQWLFGNTPTDAETYAKSGLPLERRVLIDYADSAHGGRSVSSWTQLVTEAAALPPVCKPR